MVSRSEIEIAIRQLPESEIRALASWLQIYLDDIWDQQLKSDLESGKLDSLIARAEADIANNRVRELDEILHDI